MRVKYEKAVFTLDTYNVSSLERKINGKTKYNVPLRLYADWLPIFAGSSS